MAWNGSKDEPRRGGRGGTSCAGGRLRKAAAVVGVLLVAASAAYFLLPRQEPADVKEPPKAPGLGGMIAEATPSAGPRQQEAVEAPRQTAEERRRAEIKYFEDRYGTNMPSGVKSHVYFLKNPPKKSFKIRSKFDYFRHPVERQIASLILVTPGSFMLFPPEYGESFNRDFLAAALDGTKPLPDDDEETLAMKEAVAETIRDMAATQKREGKLPNEILNEHGALLYELGQYEKNLEEELVRAKSDPSVSDDEVSDLFAAANKLRRDRGLPEWKVPDFSKRSLRLQRKLMKRKGRE